MSGLLGHAALGLVFLLVGLWHLFNHTKLHLTRHHKPLVPWFPTSLHRHLELYLILVGCTAFSISELHNWPLLDPDGSFPAIRLHHYEHATMATTFSLYSLAAITLDKLRPPNNAHNHLVWLVAALAFAQQLLLFHFHSTDHVGVERQYHLLLELLITVCLATTIMGIGWPRSFAVSFVRSLSIAMQGLWLMVMGLMLWTPGLLPKSCEIRFEKGRETVGCVDEDAVERARALVNIEFSWILIGVMAMAVGFYGVMVRKYDGLMVSVEEDVRFKHGEDEEGFLHGDGRRGLAAIDLED